VLFTADAWPGLADGSITLTFRTWSRPQAKTGGRYRVAGMLLEAIDVRTVPADSITDDDAHRAGETDAASLAARLCTGVPGQLVWRVELRLLGPDDRVALREDAELDPEELAALRRRLDRLDRSGDGGPWTRRTLQLIHRYPGIVSTALARHANMDRAAFKMKVRKLKEIGLTESLEVGYRLSPRGVALLAELDR
jgi:DNA-binding MarR family transcriptional regulator